MILGNSVISARLIEKNDKSALLKWLTDPTVLEFYEGRDKIYNENEIEKDFYAESNEVKLIIELNIRLIGYIQFYKIDDEGYSEYDYDNRNENVFGIDLFIGENQLWNAGYGTTILKLCLEYLFNVESADAVIIDPHCDNERATHVYEKIGFKKIKILKKQELHEGEMKDCWLMECRKEN